MSFNRLDYDTCSYEHTLTESTGPGVYQLTTPPNTYKVCHSNDPRIRLQTNGVSINKAADLIDIDSELIGISRNNTSCPTKKFIPKYVNNCQPNSKVCIDNKKTKIEFDDCFTKTEDTRLSNPACNLRGTGWNRWEWLPRNPQDRLEKEFDNLISSKILAKDSHRPCIPNPLEQDNVYPEDGLITEEEELEESANMLDKYKIFNFPQVPTSPPSVNWMNLKDIENY